MIYEALSVMYYLSGASEGAARRPSTMVEFGGNKTIDRRGFLKGSAWLATAVAGVALARPVLAQSQDPAKTDDDTKKDEKKPEQGSEQGKKDAPAKQGEQAKNADPDKLLDKNGVEYRVCERCGGNMYKEGATWTCEQCGFTYTE